MVWHAVELRGAARRMRGAARRTRTLRVTPALLALRRNTWRGAADVEDAGIHGMTFKYAGRRKNPLKCEGGMCFHVPGALGGTKSLSGGPRIPQDGPQKVPGGPRMRQDGPQIRVFTCFPCAWQSLRFHHTCFYVSAVVSASSGAVCRHGYLSHSGGLLAQSYVKTRASSDGAETASV